MHGLLTLCFDGDGDGVSECVAGGVEYSVMTSVFLIQQKKVMWFVLFSHVFKWAQ